MKIINNFKPIAYSQKLMPPVSFGASDSNGASPINVKDIPENEVVKYIMSGPKDYTLRNKDGDTFLHQLTEVGYFYAIKSLLANPSRTKNIINLTNKNDETPLDKTDNPMIKKFLVMKGAKSGSALPKENAQVASARVQVSKPDFMNVFKKAIKQQEVVEEKTEVVPETVSKEPQTRAVAPVEHTECTTCSTENTEEIEDAEFTEIKSETDSKQYQPPKLSEFNKFKSLTFLSGDPSGFDDVIGLEDIKEELKKSIVAPLNEEKTSNLLMNNKIDIPNGILLLGNTGNGKAHLLKALAAETKLPVIELTDLRELDELTETASKLYKKNKQRVILFVRGLDGFVENNSSCSGQKCNDFVRNLDQCAKRGILVVGTTKDKNGVNPEAVVPGIIDKVFKIMPPDDETRNNIISKYINDKPVFDEVSHPEFVKAIVEHTAGFSVAQIIHVFDETARMAAFRGNEKVTLPDVLGEIKEYSKEQEIPEINEFNKTSMFDTVLKRVQYKKGDPQSMAEIGGMNDVKEQINKKIIEPWKNKDLMDKFGIGMPDGVLLYGPPGSGKTYMVKGIARELKLPLYKMNLSDVGSSFRHETVKKIKEIVTQLTDKYNRTGEASVLFLDELDSLGKSKGDGTSGADNDEVNTLLQELDNAGDKGIIVIGATNKLDQIEGALARDGRMGERIYVGYADFDSRVDMIHNILASKSVTEEFAKDEEFVKKLAADFDSMPSGSIAKVLKEASYQMAVKNQPFDKGVKEALDAYQEKELNDHLARKGIKNRGDYLKLDKNSTIKYDTTYDRTFLKDNEPQNFSELGGMQDVKEQLKTHIIDMYKPEVIQLFKENGIPMPGGAILSGPSANGKTTIVRALSGEMKLPLYEMDYGDVGDSYIHETSKKEHELFDQLAYKYKKTGERSLLLMDELDKFVPQRSSLGNNSNYKQEEVSELLSMMNDASDNGIILIGTTNHFDKVEDAVKNNPRRMGIHINVGYPDYESRKEIIEKTLQGKPVAKALLENGDLDELINMFDGCTVGRMTDVLRKAIVDSLIKKQELSIDSIKKFISA